MAARRYSQNGWSVSWDQMASYTVPSAPKIRLTLRKGDASVVLLAVAELYHRTVESLIAGQCGGYNDRSIIGASTISNHGSGTAEDLNWQKHARGKKNTYTEAQIKQIKAILAWLDGVVRCGEFYVTATVDGMHFELIGTPAEVAKAADKVRAWRKAGAKWPIKAVAAPKPKPPASSAQKPGSRVLSLKTPPMAGPDVGFVQRWIGPGRCGPDNGQYNAKTAAGVKWWQQQQGLAADGVMGPKSWSRMLGRVVKL